MKVSFTSRRFVFIVAVLCCILWGSAYPSIKLGYRMLHISNDDIFSEILFAGYRFLYAGLIVLVIARLSGKKIFQLSNKDILKVSILGITQTSIQYIFFYIGLSNTTGINGSIMNSTGTFFSVILAHYIYKDDKLNTNKIIGCIVGFLGIILINFNEIFRMKTFVIEGDGFIILASFIFSAAAIYGKKLTRSMDVMVVTGYNLFFGGVILTLTGLLFDGRISNFNINSSMLLIYMAFLSAIAFSLWALLLKYNKVGQVSIYSFFIPIFGSILSSIILGENIINLKNISAILCVCIGIYLVSKCKYNA